MARMKSVNNASRGSIDSRSSPKKRGIGGGDVAPMESWEAPSSSGPMMADNEYPPRKVKDDEMSSAAQALNILRKDREASRKKARNNLASSNDSFIVLNEDPLNVKTASVHENSFVPLDNIMEEVHFANFRKLSTKEVFFKLGSETDVRNLPLDEGDDDCDEAMKTEREILIRAAQRHETYMMSQKLPEAMKMLFDGQEGSTYLHPEWRLTFSRIQMARGVYDHLKELIVHSLRANKEKVSRLSLDTLSSVERGVDILVRHGFVELFKSPPMSTPRFQSIQDPQDSPIDVKSGPYSFETMFSTHVVLIINDSVRGQPLLAIRRCSELIRVSRNALDIADVLILSALVCEIYCLMRNGVNTDAGIRAFRAMQDVDAAMAKELGRIFQNLQHPSQTAELKGMVSPDLFREVWQQTLKTDESFEQVELLRWAVCLNPRAQLGWLYLAWSLDAFPAKRDLAKEAAMVGVNVEPGNPEGWILCGNLYDRRQQFEDAQEAFNAARCIAGNDGHALNLTITQSLVDNVSQKIQLTSRHQPPTKADTFFRSLRQSYRSFFTTSAHMDLLVNHMENDGNSKAKGSTSSNEPFLLKLKPSPANDPAGVDPEPEQPKKKEPTTDPFHDRERVDI
eukprot:gb/GECG01013618.1/.p1 GENE.gb/GECG01013618.1/~~gb/GECG01013618.1/.p1  ORF type:complete len:623 (+),score=77.35 gb/GECG01013618.1/:1-1869(+)